MSSSRVFLLRGHPGRHEPPSPGTCLVIPVDELVVALPERLTPGHRVSVEQNLTARWRHVTGNDVPHVEPIQVPGKWFHWIPGQIGEYRKPISDVHHVVRDIPTTSDANKWKKCMNNWSKGSYHFIGLFGPFSFSCSFQQEFYQIGTTTSGLLPPRKSLIHCTWNYVKLPKNIFHDLDLLGPLSNVVLSKHFFNDDIGKDAE